MISKHASADGIKLLQAYTGILELQHKVNKELLIQRSLGKVPVPNEVFLQNITEYKKEKKSVAVIGMNSFTIQEDVETESYTFFTDMSGDLVRVWNCVRIVEYFDA